VDCRTGRAAHTVRLLALGPMDDLPLIAINRAVTQFGPSWEKVSKIVLRAPADCRDRHRNHLSDVERNRNRGTSPRCQGHPAYAQAGKWTKEEEDDLIRIVTEMLAAPGRQPGDEIFWTRVSEKMSGRRGKQQCRDKWYDA
jgi:hypothetical protein